MASHVSATIFAPEVMGAVQVFIHRLRKYLGAYLIELEGATDAIVFSAGVFAPAVVRRQPACALDVRQAELACVPGKACANDICRANASAGIGENNPMTRRLCLKGLEVDDCSH